MRKHGPISEGDQSVSSCENNDVTRKSDIINVTKNKAGFQQATIKSKRSQSINNTE